MKLKDFKNKLLQNPEFRKEYYKDDIPFEMSKRILSARIKRGVTQKKLAELVNTGQSSIARIEKGDAIPTLGLLFKIAVALKMYLVLPQFIPMEEIKFRTDIKEAGKIDSFINISDNGFIITSSKVNLKAKKSANLLTEANL